MLINKIKEHLSERIENGELTNSELVQLIELIGGYLNIDTIPNYATANGLTYNGAKKRIINNPNIEKIKIFNTNFIIDNE